MDFDLRSVPFSRNGAYLAFSILPQAGKLPAGLYLRCVHGGAQAVLPAGRMALIEPVFGGKPLPYQVSVSPARLELLTVRGSLSICIVEPWVLRVRCEGVGLRLSFDANQGPNSGAYAIPAEDECCRINYPAYLLQLMLSPLAGSWVVDAPWNGVIAEHVIAELLPADGEEVCEGAIEEYAGSWRPRTYEGTFEDCVAVVEMDYNHWLEQTPRLPGEYGDVRQLAAYVNWASVVEPIGHFLRPSMYMSKNWMTNVWSWDHCFNAMALTYHKPMMAWDQLMTIFDQQDEHGALPDYYNDRSVVWNFCKPPIHGWVLNWMMQRTQFIRMDQVRQIYGPLCRWTEWWFRYRDSDRDGVPEYHHGNDSGWDNATPFQAGVPLESPDLCAFLVLQMEALAKLADLLNSGEEVESWQRRSEDLLDKMIAHFWQGDHFVAMHSGDHEVGDTESLLLYLPLILGKRLPVAVRRELIDGLTRPGRFLTPFGLATEAQTSPAYVPDGYWRGPIWAPSTLILVEGLAACGELELSRDIARRFCNMAARYGMAENFDALTGEGLRDRAYTWTSSVFLVLGHEYLTEK